VGNKTALMNPYFFLYYCAFVMVRKLAYKNWSDRVPESAMYFLNGMAILFVGVILYYFVGPPPKGQSLIVVALAIAFGIAGINYFIFTYKGRYKKIVEYYESKYTSRPPWMTYFIIPICYIVLIYFFSVIHDHYDDYYRINGLK
jgi:hypothetical protein